MKDNQEEQTLIVGDKAEFLDYVINSVGASIHIMKVDEKGNTLPLWMNKQYSAVTGYNFKDRLKIGMNYKKDELYHPDDIEIIRSGIKDAFNNRDKNHVAMFRVKTSQGTWKWVLSTIKVIELNQKDYLLSVVVDVSENMKEYAILVERYAKEIAALKHELLLQKLTKCEKIIIGFLSQGMSTREIANELNRSYETINNHKRNIFKKLNIHKLSELIAFAVETGLN